MSAEQSLPAIDSFVQSAPLDMDEVLALQALVHRSAVTQVLDKGRKVWLLDEDPFTQAFCVMENGSLTCRDGSKDTFLGVRMCSPEPGEGAMTLSFKAQEYGGVDLHNSRRKTYQFRWNHDQARGRVVVRSVMSGKSRAAKLGDGRDVSDTTSLSADVVIRPIRDGDISQISHRMMEVIRSAKGRRITPQRILNRVNYYQDIAEFSPKGVLHLVA